MIVVSSQMPTWTPANIGGDFLFESSFIRTTQPTPDDWNFEFADTSRFGSGANTLLSKVDIAGRGRVLQVECTGTTNPIAFQSGKFIVGCRNLIGIDHRTDGGAITRVNVAQLPYANIFVSTASVWTTTISEYTVTGDGFRLYGTDLGAAPGVWCQYDNMWVRNLSISEVTCLGNMGKLLQGASANMPWSSDVNAPASIPQNNKPLIYHDNADMLVSDQAAASWSWMNAVGSEWSMFIPIRFTTVGVWQAAFRTYTAYTAANVGMALVVASNNALRLYACNGAVAGYAGTAASAVAADTWYLLELHRTADDKIQFILSGAEILAPAVIPAVGGAFDQPLIVGQGFKSTESLRAKRGRIYLYKGALSATNKTKVRNWYAHYYNI